MAGTAYPSIGPCRKEVSGIPTQERETLAKATQSQLMNGVSCFLEVKFNPVHTAVHC